MYIRQVSYIHNCKTQNYFLLTDICHLRTGVSHILYCNRCPWISEGSWQKKTFNETYCVVAKIRT